MCVVSLSSKAKDFCISVFIRSVISPCSTLSSSDKISDLVMRKQAKSYWHTCNAEPGSQQEATVLGMTGLYAETSASVISLE